MNGNNQSAPWTYVVGIAGALILVLLLVRSMQTHTRPGALGADRAATRAQNLEELRQVEAKATTEYSWINQELGIARMPVEAAMDLVIEDYKDPATSRAAMIERALKKFPPPPPPEPEAPSEFE